MNNMDWMLAGGFASMVLCLIGLWRLIKHEIRQEIGGFRVELRTLSEKSDFAHLVGEIRSLDDRLTRIDKRMNGRMSELRKHVDRRLDRMDGRMPP